MHDKELLTICICLLGVLAFCTACPEHDGYVFFPTVDSKSEDIGNFRGNVKSLMETCDSRDDCVAFNSNGWAKHTLTPVNEWYTWTNNPCLGLYVKQGVINMKDPLPSSCPSHPGYMFYPTMDSSGHDLGNFPWAIPQLLLSCDANPECVAFNSNGWLKYTIKEVDDWARWTSDPCRGIYVKNIINATDMDGNDDGDVGDADGAPGVGDINGQWPFATITFDPVTNTGFGQWNNDDRPNFSIERDPDNGELTIDFPDDRTYKAIAPNNNTIDFGDDNIWRRVSPDMDACPDHPGYVFYPTMDSDGSDIGNYEGDVTSLIEACDEKNDCVAFNSNGWLKHSLQTTAKWYSWTSDLCKGLYVKQGVTMHTHTGLASIMEDLFGSWRFRKLLRV